MSIVPVCREKYYEILKKKMEEKSVFIVSTNSCPYCIKAKNLLDSNNIDSTIFNLDDFNEEERIEFGHCIYGAMSRRFVPFIFVEGQAIGSYSELLQAQKQGYLSQYAADKKGSFL